MPMVKIESWEEFALRHGGDGIEDDGRWLFPDGAMTDRGDMVRWEPPTDPTQKLKTIRLYWQVRVEAAERAFNNCKSDLLYRAYWAERGVMPALNDDDAAILKELKKNVTTLRRALAKVEKQLADTPEEQARRRREEAEANLRQDQFVMASQIRDIRL